MYNWEKSSRGDRLRKTHQNPSFSSTLLDQIYRSIDGGDKNCSELNSCRDRTSKKQSNGGGGTVKPKTSAFGDEETARLRRACLLEKLMEKKKVSTGKSKSLPELDRKSQLDNNDPLFLSSSSSSSDSSFEGFSSSETEFSSTAKSRNSYFAVPKPRPKPIITNVSASLEKPRRASSLFIDDYHNHQDNNDDLKNEEALIKSKSRALKIYSNLKKMKQPISPRGRVSSFINSLFTSGAAKKTTKSTSSVSVEGYDYERKSKSTQDSTCSSASSYYRSCLSKKSPKSREKLNNGVKRTVRFYPVSVIVDEDCRPCGHKCIYPEEGYENFGKSQFQSKKDFFKGYRNQDRDSKNQYDDNDDDDQSDSSSDLFEIDHLALIGDNRYCEELPVYETTQFDRNRAIFNALNR